MIRKKNMFRKESDFVNRKMDFPELAPTVKQEETTLDYKNLKHIEKEEDKNKIPDGWVKLYYKNGKIVKEYGRIWNAKPKYRESATEGFTRVIGIMRERWEQHNEDNELEIDYDYYWEQNEYEEEEEKEISILSEMNSDLIDGKRHDD